MQNDINKGNLKKVEKALKMWLFDNKISIESIEEV